MSRDRNRDKNGLLSRRHFLVALGLAPAISLPGSLNGSTLSPSLRGVSGKESGPSSHPEFRLTPHYRAKSPLDDVLRRVEPGFDEYVTEKFSSEIEQVLTQWSQGLKASPPAAEVIAGFLDPSIVATPLSPSNQVPLRAGDAFEVLRRRFTGESQSGGEAFLRGWTVYLAPFSNFETAEFEIVGIRVSESSPPAVETQLRYDLVGVTKDGLREERLGIWQTEWVRDEPKGWRVRSWKASEETCSRVRGPAFTDVTVHALGQTESYKNQMLRGADTWRTLLDGACGTDVYGNQGVAAGDMDNDGWDDLYVCQPAGLPNRLYRNRGDGTFEDVTEAAGVAVLDNTPCALFADFTNNGWQDLLVVAESGPLLFLNQGGGKFLLKRDAFRFAQPPQGTFTAAAASDYDRDGLLDVYFCVYNYYLGLDQYQYPAPYYDAQNGSPNFLFHNQGNATFQDRTAASGMNRNNNRYSFACGWSDYDHDGWPDLYVANDFGRKNLYRNNRDGTFTDVAQEAGAEDIGAGMGVAWFDCDNDGNQDLYVTDMWSSAGMRVTTQAEFHKGEPENIRALYRKHARGNALLRNRGNGRFEDVTLQAGVETGRWAWSADAWDFDHDGFPDLYVADGYISGPDTRDLSSFFWRQVVSQSPQKLSPAANYERGWNAINELIRSDRSWNGYERNVFFANNRDGTFSNVSGAVGMDFPEDGRAFALADLDHDGRLEVILKNRNAPQLRILRNNLRELGAAIVFRLRGHQSNRDGIGAEVTVETGELRQTKFLQAGSGFLSQHTKELFFGLGKAPGSVGATVRWPNGLIQNFANLPVNQRIEIQEGSEKFAAQPFGAPAPAFTRPAVPQIPEPLPRSAETWLIEPLRAPDFTLPDLEGRAYSLQSFRGQRVLLNFWTMENPACNDELRLFQKYQSSLASHRLQILALNVNSPSEAERVRSFARAKGLTFLILLAGEEVSGLYNVTYRYLFDRRRNLGIPTSFLVDENGRIVKIFQGQADPRRVLEDLSSLPRTPADRVSKALPFGGTLYGGQFRRNDFTYGVAFFQHGYLEQAVASFQQVIAAKPDYPEAFYNLGTLYLKKNDFVEARRYLDQSVALRPDYPDAWNNLGMIAAQAGRSDEAVRDFQQALRQKPDYVIALQNLGNLYRRQGALGEAEKLLGQALGMDPEDPEINYSMGMLFVQKNDFGRAEEYLEKSVKLRPDYPDALNNLGVLLVREGRPREALKKFEDCIRVAPHFDQGYLNLARIYVTLGDKEKAGRVLRELLELQPQHKAAQQALDQLQR